MSDYAATYSSRVPQSGQREMVLVRRLRDPVALTASAPLRPRASYIAAARAVRYPMSPRAGPAPAPSLSITHFWKFWTFASQVGENSTSSATAEPRASC